MKFLIWLVIGAAVVTWIMRFKSTLANSGRAGREKSETKGVDAAETMLRCMRCGVHFPASEALFDSSGTAFCCEEHRAQREVR